MTLVFDSLSMTQGLLAHLALGKQPNLYINDDFYHSKVSTLPMLSTTIVLTL